MVDLYDFYDDRVIDYFEEEDDMSSDDAGFMRGYLAA